jgi:hypothetical protein
VLQLRLELLEGLSLLLGLEQDVSQAKGDEVDLSPFGEAQLAGALPQQVKCCQPPPSLIQQGKGFLKGPRSADGVGRLVAGDLLGVGVEDPFCRRVGMGSRLDQF